MPKTCFFPQFRLRLAALGQRVDRLRCHNLSHLEQLLGSFFPPHLLSQTEAGSNSRERIFSVRRTFFGFLYQVLNPNCPCREVVRQIQAFFALHDLASVDKGSSAYCQARKRLPLDTLQRLRLSVTATSQRTASAWRGFHLRVLDGTTISLPDTFKNQRAYPQPKSQKPGCGFPLLKLVAIFSLTTGALLHYVKGNKRQHELRLLLSLLPQFKPSDLVMADRGFCSYVALALLLSQGAHSILRLHQSRPSDLRRGKRLAKSDRLMMWKKPNAKPLWLPLSWWRRIPAQLPVRVLRFNLRQRGFRPRSVSLVTTLTESQKYSAMEIAQLYARRWCIELWFRDIKTAMGMEVLRCQSPEMIHKELEIFFIAYNLIRCWMADAATVHHTALERLSFKGTVDSVRQFSIVIAQTSSKKKQKQLIAQLLELIARDKVPERLGRREPRAVKRRPKPYERLSAPRHLFREISHRSNYHLKKTHKNRFLN